MATIGSGAISGQGIMDLLKRTELFSYKMAVTSALCQRLTVGHGLVAAQRRHVCDVILHLVIYTPWLSQKAIDPQT